MNRYANKAEVMLALEQGAQIESHDSYHWLVKKDGETARLRYSLWCILTKGRGVIAQVRREIRPPSRLPFFIYRLRTSEASGASENKNARQSKGEPQTTRAHLNTN